MAISLEALPTVLSNRLTIISSIETFILERMKSCYITGHIQLV